MTPDLDTNAAEPTGTQGARMSGENKEGPSSQPGGDVDLGNSAVPPYEGRSTGDEEVAAGVPRAMGSEEPLREPEQPGADGPDETDPSDAPPAHTGESTTRRGEDVADQKGKESGRDDTGTDEGSTDRPTGTSDMRDRTGVDPEETNTGQVT